MAICENQDIAECRKFVHTIYLAPQGNGNGYFIKNDILHIITHDHLVAHESKPVAPITSKDIDPRFYSDSENVRTIKVSKKGERHSVTGPFCYSKSTYCLKNSNCTGRGIFLKSSGVANADENMDALDIEEPVAVQEEFSQSDTPTTPTLTGRGGGNNTKERDSGGRDKENMDALDIITHHHQVPHELKPVAPLTSKDIDPGFHSEHPPPVMDNGNLDESAVKMFEGLMSQKVNDIEFPTLQQQQLQPQKKQRGRYDLQIQPDVREIPPAQDEASSSISSSVANVDDPTPENMDAVQEEPPQIPDGSDLQKQPIVSETLTAQEEASSSSVANADVTTPENMAVQEEPPQIPDVPNAEAGAIIQGGRGRSRRRKTLETIGKLPNVTAMIIQLSLVHNWNMF
ncbi:uncharacterized protein [Medicago truncatula]|uniref:uncharacterized protein n=1 Tax=Medicago truncatula TaxID=3880 RepID=UPI001967D1F3|nr:uncharacterized protein LOC120578287 [Medicago truncatula]